MSGFSVSGLGSGIDFSLYVNAIISSEQEALARTLGRREVETASKQAVYSNIKGAVSSLSASINSFKFSGDFKKKVLNFSDPTKISGTASLDALNQTAKISVQSLAQNEVQRFEFTDVEDSVTSATGEVTINVRGEEFTFEVESGTSLKDLATQINDQNIGVTAAAFDNQDPDDPLPAKLTITDNQAGDYDGGTPNVTFDFSNLTLLTDSPVTVVTGTNAEATVNGITVFSESNTLKGVLPGVNLVLNDVTEEGEEISLTVTESIEGSASQVASLVEKYNSVVQAIRQAIAFNPNDPTQSSPTSGDSTLRNVLTRLQNDFLGTIDSLPTETDDGENSIRSLADLGVNTNFDVDDPSLNGTLTFDQSEFNSLVVSDFEDVITFFEGITIAGTPYDGWVDKLEDTMDSFLGSTDGAISSKIKSFSEELNRINKEKIEKLERIAAKEERLTLRFARLEGRLAGLNAQQSTLDASIQSLQLNNQAISRNRR